MIWIWFLVGFIGHEITHYLAARFLGLNATFAWKVGCACKYWRGDGETVAVTDRERIVVSLAGPMFNLGLAILFPASAVPNIMLFLLNLLPFKGSDGWNIARSLR